jgi:pimeloyl-ACP methyl ester carboxylesterase
MGSIGPYFREAGFGPAVICIHAGYSSSGQWRSLTESLAHRFRVIACDMSNSGKSPATSSEVKYTLDEEVTFLGPVFQAAGDSFHLVGHSFGGAVAIKAALRHRGRVQSLTLFEPALFALLVSSAPESPAGREINRHTESTSHLADLGHHEAAAEEFVDYWFQRGAWAAMREEVRADIRGGMGLARQRWDALLRDPVGLSDIASIDAVTLYLTGKKSKLPTRALSQLLISAIPRVRSIDIEGVGHMAPLSNPDLVNPLIEAFLREVTCS